ncbi:serine/threonine-protein kinase [Streptococcus himalayensis]|uniref:Protein kinase domain-containing protein n=1 Tax=Streptococcus himalayensis TaxID=1888195 RepID=A0A917A6Z3_9STRE|nr:serine/threonine-protein kinase [Streptococcus himalayensis]GGE27338.1 hypothetical protein GCM10011510_05630 [Streptococcus himalayensis]
MSKEYIEKEVLPKLRIDCQSGVLLYDECPFQLDNGLYPFHNLEFIAQLSYGANGITYRVLHKMLGIEQLVKLYFFTDHISKEKALTESIKNSTLNLADSIARVHDLGILSQPVEVVYSIMEFVGNSMTLKDYLDNRTSFWNILSELSPGEELLQYNSIFGPLFQESINISVYFLRGISYLIKSNIRHGDLHLDNILICNSLFSSNLLEDIEKYKSVTSSDSKSVDTGIRFIKDKLKHYYSNYFGTEINVGIIGEDSLSVKLIDLGASHVKPSTIEKTNQRDTWFIYNTISELLQPFFEAKGQMNGLMEFAFFKKIKLYGQVKKLEYHFPLENYSPETGGDYISNSDKVIKIRDGKCVGIDDLIFEELLENREIFQNRQVIPYLMQHENVDKDLMFSNKKCYNGQIPYQMLAAELFKVLGIVNTVYGTIFNSKTPNIDDRLEQEIFNIIYFGTLGEEGEVLYNNFVISPLFDYKFHEAGNLLLRPNSRGKIWSNNLLFDYPRLYNFLKNY